MWSHKSPHKAGAVAISTLLMKSRLRGKATCLRSHSCEEAVLEFHTDGADGVDIGDANGDNADPDFTILVVGLGSHVGQAASVLGGCI